jgi:hypothetical protein
MNNALNQLVEKENQLIELRKKYDMSIACYIELLDQYIELERQIKK